jgi:hypothetical protein
MGDGSVQSASLLGYVCDDDDSVRNLTSATVMKIKKCCLNGTYDPESHICRENTYVPEILQNVILRDTACFVNMAYGLSKCDPSEAVVSVVVSSYSTELLTNGGLVVNTRNTRLTLDDDTFCVNSVVNSIGTIVVKFCQSVSTACREGPCVQKCCPERYGFIKSSSCRHSGFDFNPKFYIKVATDSGFEHVATTVPSFAILCNLQCEIYDLKPEVREQDVSYLEVDGRLYAPKHFDRHLTTDRYCLEKVFLPEYGMDGVYTFPCYSEERPVEDNWLLFLLYNSEPITSGLFFYATFQTYARLPNLREKILMCHVVSLFVAYTCLCVAHVGDTIIDQFFCAVMGESVHC